MKRLLITTSLALCLFTTQAHALQQVRNPDTSAFHKWERVMQQAPITRGKPKVLSKMTIYAINSSINVTKYLEDMDNYGQSNYWATPKELYANGGDCEDFAIAKYYRLAERGIPLDQMEIVIVVIKKTQELHALLKIENDGLTWYLDNRDNTLHGPDYIKGFVRAYGINHEGWAR